MRQQFPVECNCAVEQLSVNVQVIGVVGGRCPESVRGGSQPSCIVNAYRLADSPQAGHRIGAKRIVADEYALSLKSASTCA